MARHSSPDLEATTNAHHQGSSCKARGASCPACTGSPAAMVCQKSTTHHNHSLQLHRSPAAMVCQKSTTHHNHSLQLHRSPAAMVCQKSTTQHNHSLQLHRSPAAMVCQKSTTKHNHSLQLHRSPEGPKHLQAINAYNKCLTHLLHTLAQRKPASAHASLNRRWHPRTCKEQTSAQASKQNAMHKVPAFACITLCKHLFLPY